MDKKIKYYSLDKLYFIKKKYFTKKIKEIFIISFFLLMSILSFFLYNNSIEKDRERKNINYAELGEVDYKVYLKDNDYYAEGYLPKDMQYVSSLIKTINVDYIYDLKTEEELNYSYVYSIKTNLKITEQNNKDRILYVREEELLEESNQEIANKDIHIEEDIDIDYDKYNNYVNAFKRDYGLAVSSDLEVLLSINLKANVDSNDNVFNDVRQLKVIIPLSEQTINIGIDTKTLDSKGIIELSYKRSILTILYLLMMILSFLGLIIYVMYTFFFRNNADVYNSKVNKILREYDRLIVEGTVDLNEKDYTNKIYLNKFEELVDASQILNVPILYYNVIPNEKCFFVVINESTIYKYIVTRAYQNMKKEGMKKNEKKQ